MKINKIDAKLLGELENDGLQTLSQIAKKLRVSRELLRYRLNSLEKRNIISGFFTIINFTMFGYSLYRTMIRISNINRKKYNEIILDLMSHPNIEAIAKCGGKWDLIVNFMAKNVIQYNDFMKEIQERFPNQIQNYDILLVVEILDLGRDYFYKKIREAKDISYFGREFRFIKKDKIDLKILNLISEDGKMKYRKIAEELGIKSQTVSKRIKNMKKENVILGVKPLIHIQDTSYSCYKALIKFQNMTERRKDEIINHLKTDVNIIALIKVIGQWDFEIEFEVNSTQAMQDFTRDIRDKFKNVIKEFEIIPLFYVYKYNFFPRDMLSNE